MVRSLAKAKTGLLRQLRALLQPAWLLPEMLSGNAAVPTVVVEPSALPSALPVSGDSALPKEDEDEDEMEVEVVKVPDLKVGNEVELVDGPEFPVIPGMEVLPAGDAFPALPEPMGPIDPINPINPINPIDPIVPMAPIDLSESMGTIENMGHIDGDDPEDAMGSGTKKGSLADSLQLKLEAMGGDVDNDEVFGLDDSFTRFQAALDKEEEKDEKDEKDEDLEKKADSDDTSDSSDSDLDLNAIPL